MNDQFSADSTPTSKNSEPGYPWMSRAIPALMVGFGAFCYQTGYQEALKQTPPTIVQGSQTVNTTTVYQIAPSVGIGSNNNRQTVE
ncbi:MULTISPECIES: hypothetical protein [unclassified Microcoleus]|uniref:hypothetical protein n=1 Tax=unclassified Microcoleus TaxID=2642155 RepID=UPI002FD1BF27